MTTASVPDAEPISPVPATVPSPGTIDRSASDSAKGPRLQRLRAALFIVKATSENANIQAYAAVEAHGDAYLATATAEGVAHYAEEDKNYDPSGSFTFVSPAIINSMVLFVDQWIEWRASESLRFGLYTTVDCAKERNAGRVKELGLSLPSKSLLGHLRDRDYTDPSVLPCVKALVLDEYERQYKAAGLRGHEAVLRSWSDQDWRVFLSKIVWLFGSEDEVALEAMLLAAIEAAPYFTDAHRGKAELISAVLLDLFDKKQTARVFAARFVHASQVELIFSKVASGEVQRVDPTWRRWGNVPAPADQRNITEKLLAVCPEIPIPTLARLQRRTAAGLDELNELQQDKNVVAMQFWIYDTCEQVLSNARARAILQSEPTGEDLEREIENLTQASLIPIRARAADYRYSYTSETLIRGLLLTLFDSCYLTFDRKPA